MLLPMMNRMFAVKQETPDLQVKSVCHFDGGKTVLENENSDVTEDDAETYEMKLQTFLRDKVCDLIKFLVGIRKETKQLYK